MVDSQSGTGNETTKTESGLIVVLNKDLFFGVKIGNVLRGLGYEVAFAKTTEHFVPAIEKQPDSTVLGIIDLNAGIDWNLIATLTRESGPGVPLLVFGSHLDVDGFRAAKAAGVNRVVSNGDFHRDMVTFVRRYARGIGESESTPATGKTASG